MKIPYALQSGSKVIEPGEYRVEYKSVKGDRIMTVQDSKGDVLLRTTAAGTDPVPTEERNFAGGLPAKNHASSRSEVARETMGRF